MDRNKRRESKDLFATRDRPRPLEQTVKDKLDHLSMVNADIVAYRKCAHQGAMLEFLCRTWANNPRDIGTSINACYNTIKSAFGEQEAKSHITGVLAEFACAVAFLDANYRVQNSSIEEDAHFKIDIFAIDTAQNRKFALQVKTTVRDTHQGAKLTVLNHPSPEDAREFPLDDQQEFIDYCLTNGLTPVYVKIPPIGQDLKSWFANVRQNLKEQSKNL